MPLDQIPHNFMTAQLEDVVRWGRRNSVFPATFGLACCALEWGPVRDVLERLPGPLLRTDAAVYDPNADDADGTDEARPGIEAA